MVCIQDHVVSHHLPIRERITIEPVLQRDQQSRVHLIEVKGGGGREMRYKTRLMIREGVWLPLPML